MNANTASSIDCQEESEKRSLGNIIQFPRDRIVSTIQDPTTVMTNLIEMKVASVEDAIGFIIPTLFEAILLAGFEVEDDRLNNLLVGVTRAIMYKHYNLDHPLHDFVDINSDLIDSLLIDQISLALDQPVFEFIPEYEEEDEDQES